MTGRRMNRRMPAVPAPAALLALLLLVPFVPFPPSGVLGPSAQAPPTKTFHVVAERYEFTPDYLAVDEGDTVQIVLTSADVTHGFAVRGLKLDVEVPKGGEPVTLEFVAEKAGRFQIRCSEYCGLGHRRMRGWLVVYPRVADGGGR
jgi:cytochrome c oxidase subunit II